MEVHISNPPLYLFYLHSPPHTFTVKKIGKIGNRVKIYSVTGTISFSVCDSDIHAFRHIWKNFSMEMTWNPLFAQFSVIWNSSSAFNSVWSQYSVTPKKLFNCVKLMEQKMLFFGFDFIDTETLKKQQINQRNTLLRKLKLNNNKKRIFYIIRLLYYTLGDNNNGMPFRSENFE
jgi:hypothetical protein